MGNLVAANPAALTHLTVHFARNSDEALRPLAAALRHNTHLRDLHMGGHNLSLLFVRTELAPAVHANTGLRCLDIHTRIADQQQVGDEGTNALLAQLEQHAAARRDASA